MLLDRIEQWPVVPELDQLGREGDPAEPDLGPDVDQVFGQVAERVELAAEPVRGQIRPKLLKLGRQRVGAVPLRG